MVESDGKRFRDLLRGMGRMYGQDLDNLVLDAYWLALRDWDFADFEAAAAHLMATAKFMPRPAEFNALRKAGEPTAGEAWAEVLDYVRRGFHRWTDGGISPVDGFEPLLDRATEQAVRALGGLHAIAMCHTDRLSYLERRFCEHYEAARDAHETREALPQIATHEEGFGRLLGERRGGFAQIGAVANGKGGLDASR